MATIELKNICKFFKASSKKGSVVEFMHPMTAMFRTMKMVEARSAIHPRGGAFALENLNLTIPDGKVMVILGPSGCGKSTLLRIIAGLMSPDSGDVYYDGKNVRNIPPGDRNIGMVFQNYALYPHFVSRKNVLSYFLFKKKTPELDQLAQEKYQKTSELLGVDIEYLMDKSPATLSGGEKQRVALGRCITREPALFLLDEPFSNLDQKLREKYRLQLKKLLRHFHITTVYVTHDQQEALLLADVLTIMNIGGIEQVGTPEEIYQSPSSLFVADFLNPDIDTPAINILDSKAIPGYSDGMLVGVRSEDLALCDDADQPMTVSGTIIDVRYLPIKRTTIICVAVRDAEVYVRLPFNDTLSKNEIVRLCVNRCHFFDKENGQRIRSYPEE